MPFVFKSFINLSRSFSKIIFLYCFVLIFVPIVDLFSKRLQIQEQLTEQIANCIAKVTEAKGVGVIIEAQHFCMMMRGVEKQNSSMKTSKLLGIIRDRERTRAEFLALTT